MYTVTTSSFSNKANLFILRMAAAGSSARDLLTFRAYTTRPKKAQKVEASIIHQRVRALSSHVTKHLSTLPHRARFNSLPVIASTFNVIQLSSKL